VTFAHIGMVADQTVLASADSLMIATGFVHGNPLKMAAEANKVDNLGRNHRR